MPQPGYFLAPHNGTAQQVIPQDWGISTRQNPKGQVLLLRLRDHNFKDAFITCSANGQNDIQDIATTTVLKIGPIPKTIQLSEHHLTNLRDAASSGTDIMGLDESHQRHLRAGPLLATIKVGNPSFDSDSSKSWYAIKMKGKVDLQKLLGGSDDADNDTTPSSIVDTAAEFWYCPDPQTAHPLEESYIGWIAFWQPDEETGERRMQTGTAMLKAFSSTNSAGTMTDTQPTPSRVGCQDNRKSQTTHSFFARSKVGVADPRGGRMASSRSKVDQDGEMELALTISPLDCNNAAESSSEVLRHFNLNEESWSCIASCLSNKGLPFDSEQRCVISGESANQTLGQYGRRAWEGVTKVAVTDDEGHRTTVPVLARLTAECYSIASQPNQSWYSGLSQM